MPTATAPLHLTIRLRRPHPKQLEFVESTAKRSIIRAGRRGGKTVGIAIKAVQRFLAGQRVLYAAPTAEQLESFWFEVKRALKEPVEAGYYRKNEVDHVIERVGTKQRLRAKTAWNADTLRGDYADILILDEFQLMAEDAWETVGAPMLLDNDGEAVFIYTPPSLTTRTMSKAKDPRYISKMFAKAQKDDSGRWKTFFFSSMDNPFISREALSEIAKDMTQLAIRQELLAEDIDEIPGALWTRKLIESTRRFLAPQNLARIVIGVDPPGGSTECGIVASGMTMSGEIFVLWDKSLSGAPSVWAGQVLDLYEELGADTILAETNFGGDMVFAVLNAAAETRKMRIRLEEAHAARGKAVRAEPAVALFERNEAHIVGSMPALEDELVGWVPGSGKSPNRLDAMVWSMAGLGVDKIVRPVELDANILFAGLTRENPWKV